MHGRLSLVAADARGHGDSGKPERSEAAYAPEEFVADALAILDTYGVARAAVVGHSMGAAHATALASDRPERVSRLVLVDTSPEPLPEGAGRARRLTLGRPERFADLEEAMAYVRRTSPGYTEEVYANRRRWLFRETADGAQWRSSRTALATILDEPRRHAEMWRALARVTAPTLVVRGTRSTVLGHETAERMARTLPQGRLIELEAGHNVPLERPRELADAVAGLVEQP